MNKLPALEIANSPWAVRKRQFEPIADKEPESEHDIIYWARAVLEKQVLSRAITDERYNELLAQLA